MSQGNSGRLAGRIALVTGASRGLGAAIARAYAREGADLVLTARTVGGLEELDDEIRKINGKTSLLVPLDLKDGEAVDRLGAALYERYGRLDVLVGNAGQLGTLSPLGHIKPAEWQDVIDVNLTANWRLIRSLDPLLRQSPAGRVIFVTSGAARGPRAYWGTYAVSKAALEMLAGIYAREVEQSNLRVNLIDPGRARTRMRARAYPGEDPMSLKAPDEITQAFVDLASADFSGNGQLVMAQ
ncbi:NAD(P)-dependent dehydrogenase (short-subunit alcohol dehydrogenase family) [Dongia mobilis]|uniref:NAD(P)-dependent dehydrogenase (Short-subunit alcohol dehydrogenase family) n=1 Tax=Dongia mobilis TaxID=578943 RepID=A0A4R6WF20_9PROT|nr:SDR family NAD(P)-dependent oxidoreductase [Dongia mobilis]TDQ78492.1 NAD(P)-dependent dehydrogenase (short-subunit alcohol dehydrogenase family) [Dongia mobilis]